MTTEDETGIDDELHELIDTLAEFVACHGYDKESVIGSLSDSIDTAYEDVEGEEEDEEEEVDEEEEPEL